MSFEPVKMADGTVVLANVKEGETLTDEDKKAIAEYVQFCRNRRAKRLEKANGKRTKKGKS